MPKLKTHHWAGMTCSMKNLFGTVPGAVYGWPKNVLHVAGIHDSILDLTATVRPHLTIVDAIVGMEGDGPIMGRPRPLGLRGDGHGPRRGGRHVRAGHRARSGEDRYLDAAGHYLGNTARAHRSAGGSPVALSDAIDLIESQAKIRLSA